MRSATPLADLARLALSVLVVLATAEAARAQPASSGPTTTYVVQEGDTCASIAGSQLGSRRRYDVLHAFNPGLGAPPHDLVPGTVLVLPARGTPAPSEPDARVTAVRRDVVSRSAGAEDWHAASRGEPLFRGYRVNALERSSAELTFRDTSVVEIRANTLVIVYGATAAAARASTTSASLERGTLRARLGSLRLDVQTPSASAALDGGSSVISVDDGGSRVASHSGRPVRVRAGRAEVRLEPGFGSVVPPAAPPTPPVPLPPPPSFESDVGRAFATVSSIPSVVEGTFASVPGAARYHVEVTSLTEPPVLVASADVPADVRSFRFEGLPEGRYGITIASIDGAGLEGRPGDPHPFRILAFSIGEPTPTPTPTSEAATVATALPGARLSIPEAARCEGMADDRTMALEELGRLEARCQLDDGSPIAGVVVLVAADNTTYGLAPTATQSIARGVEVTVPFPREPGRPGLPEATSVIPSPGIRVVRFDREAGEAIVIAENGAPDEGSVVLGLARRDEGPLELARVALALDPLPVVVPELPLVPTTDVALHLVDPIAISAQTFHVDEFEISGTVGAAGYEGSRPLGIGRFDLSVRAHPRIRFDLGVMGAAPRAHTPDRFGAMGLRFGGRGQLLRRADQDLVLAVDLVIPFFPGAPLDGPMLRGALQSSLCLGRRAFLRPTAGVLVDLGSADALRAAALSVLADFVVDRVLSLGLLLDSRLGSYDDALHATGGIGTYLGLTYHRTTVSLVARAEPFAAGARLSPVWQVGLGLRTRASTR